MWQQTIKMGDTCDNFTYVLDTSRFMYMCEGDENYVIITPSPSLHRLRCPNIRPVPDVMVIAEYRAHHLVEWSVLRSRRYCVRLSGYSS